VIWPTIKRLRFLERERMVHLDQITALVEEREDLLKTLADSWKEAQGLRSRLSRLESEREIEGLLKEAAE
jgi:hypothetical protein